MVSAINVEQQALPSLPGADPGGRWKSAGVCLLLLALVLVVFGRCAGFEFVNYDDRVFVTKNTHVLQGLTWGNTVWALTAGTSKDAVDIDYWRPASMMSHMLDVQLFGLNAGAHHAMGVALHAATVAALFLVLRSMTGMLWRSAFVAAIFAVHPLHVESVAWVAERKDVLSGLFFVLMLGAYTRQVRRPFFLGNYLLVVLLFALGLMSKPSLVTVPCVLLLLDYWPLGRIGSVSAMRLVAEKIPLFAMSAGTALLTTLGPGGLSEDMMASLPWYWRVGNALVACGTYLAQTVWPAGLACFYPHPGKTLPPGSIALAAIVLAAITVMVLRRPAQRYLIVGWLWYLGMLAPVIGIVQSGLQAQADRYTYLPMIGISVMVTWAAADWAGQRKPRCLAVGSAALAGLGLLTIAAFRQTSVWRDSVTLWAHTLDSTPGNPFAHNYFGLALVAQGRTGEGIAQYREALRIRPEYAEAHCNLGIALFGNGNADEAVTHLRKAIEHGPRVAANHFNLGNALLQVGRMEDAANSFQAALALDPNYFSAENNLGLIRYQQGRREEAIAHYRRVAELTPHAAAAHSNLGVALLGTGRNSEALRHYETAIKIEPDDPVALSNLAWVLATCPDASLRNGARALELAKKARGMPGGNQPQIVASHAAAHAEMGNFREALDAAQQAIELASAAGNEGQAVSIRKQRDSYWASRPWRDETMREERSRGGAVD